jgi:hypothetical protein
MIKQGTMGRTCELAGAAFNTTDKVFVLGFFPLFKGRELGQQIGLQSHGTYTYAFGATDAGLGFQTTGFIARKNGDRVGALANGNFCRGEGFAHHGATRQEFVFAFGQPSA